MKTNWGILVNNRRIEPKPCPFCGGDFGAETNRPFIEDDDVKSVTYIFCPICKLKMEEKISSDHAAKEVLLERWNHRV